MAIDKITIDSETISDFTTNPAFHAIIGFEFVLESLALILEYQMGQVLYLGAERFWHHYVMAGIRF